MRIAFGGLKQASGGSVDTTTGLVTFSAAPGSGVAITAGFEFDVPVPIPCGRRRNSASPKMSRSRFSARLMAGFHHSSAALAYHRRMLPGNGIYLTSRTDTLAGSYTLSGRTRWSFSASAGYFRLSPAIQVAPVLQGYHAGASAGYRLTRALHLSSGYAVRRYDNGRYQQWSAVAHAGLTFAPGTLPLSTPW